MLLVERACAAAARTPMCMLWLGSTDVAGLMAWQLDNVDAMAGRLFPRLIPTHSSPLPFLQNQSAYLGFGV